MEWQLSMMLLDVQLKVGGMQATIAGLDGHVVAKVLATALAALP